MSVTKRGTHFTVRWIKAHRTSKDKNNEQVHAALRYAATFHEVEA